MKTYKIYPFIIIPMFSIIILKTIGVEAYFWWWLMLFIGIPIIILLMTILGILGFALYKMFNK